MLTSTFRSCSRVTPVSCGRYISYFSDPNTGLARENAGFDLDKLHTWKLCTCPSPTGASRAPICTCLPPKGISALAQVRWKRLVVDEGHVQGAPDTLFSTVCAKLSAERRWIMSGTPTRTLLGLNLGTSTEEDLQLWYPDTDESSPETSPSSRTMQLSEGTTLSDSPGTIVTPLSNDILPSTDGS